MPDKNIPLSDILRPVFDKAVQHYLDFTHQTPALDAKDFTAYHNACKAALAHLMLLEKLIKQSPQSDSQTSLLDLIEQAKKETQNDLFSPDEFA